MSCAFETEWVGGDRDRLAHNPEVADPMSLLPAGTRPEGFAPGGCHGAREHGSTCQLSALPHGAAARTTVCIFGFLKPSRTAHPGFVRSDTQKPTTAEACPVTVLCSNDWYASKQVKRFPFSAWKCLRRRSAAFTAGSHAEGRWFEPSRDHHVKRGSEDGFEAIDQPSGPRRAFYRAKFQNRSTAR